MWIWNIFRLYIQTGLLLPLSSLYPEDQAHALFTLLVPNAISITSPTFTLTEAFAGFPFTITRPASHASFATVLLLIRREIFEIFHQVSYIPPDKQKGEHICPP